ncbi:alpha/beta hydrolase [Bacillus sp. SRB_336]|nr:alpha/beta hydrolase [Bacillus sp. SRB_336]
MQLHDNAVHITIRDGHIAGTLISPASRMPGILLVHGWGGNQQQYQALTRELASLRCVCLTFDMSGHAATQARRETVTREDNLADLVAAYDFLAAHPLVDRAAIAVVGSSYGGYLATFLTELRPVAWLALRAPALYRDTQWRMPKQQLRVEQSLAQYRQQTIAASENRALGACATFRGDVLLVESELDRVVPRAVLVNYRHACLDAHSLTFRTISGADHALSDPGSRGSYATILRRWMEEMITGARLHGRSDVAVEESQPPA